MGDRASDWTDGAYGVARGPMGGHTWAGSYNFGLECSYLVGLHALLPLRLTGCGLGSVVAVRVEGRQPANIAAAASG